MAVVTYLEREKQFWEMTVDGKSTQVRAGKINCKGRKFGIKWHSSESEASKIAKRQISGKIIEGFADPTEKTALKRSVSSFRKERRQEQQKLSETLPVCQQMYRMPHKKRASIRQLHKQQTVIIQNTIKVEASDSDNDTQKVEDEQPSPSPKWRRPPKKQMTIRRNAMRNLTARQSTLAQKLLKAKMSVKNSSRTLSKAPTLVREPSARSAPKLTNAPTLPPTLSLQCSAGTSKKSALKKHATQKVKKSVTIIDKKTEKKSNGKKLSPSPSIPKLMTQDTMPAERCEDRIAQDLKVSRKCRSFSKSALPETFIAKSD